ncbi:MAG: hypothetical protein SOY33_06625 [Candidatus Onthovivens sp.]|nr:hypothetical protein [Bacilli bacterium]
MIQPPSVLGTSNDTKALSGNINIIGDLVNKINDVNVEVAVETKGIDEFQNSDVTKNQAKKLVNLSN